MFLQYKFAKIVKGFFDLVTTDYNDAVDKSKTLLFYYLREASFDKTILTEEGKSLFLRQPVEVKLGYHAEPVSSPTVSVTLGTDEESGGQLGVNSGQEVVQLESNSFKKAWHLRQGRIDLILTSVNSNELVVIYEILKQMFYQFSPNLSVAKIHKLKVSGRDLNLETQFSPPIHHKLVSLSFEYEEETIGSQVELKNKQLFKLLYQILIDPNIL